MKLILQNVRMSFPDIFIPTNFQGQGELKYKASFLFPKEHSCMPKIKAAINEAATEKWGAKAEAILAGIKAKDTLCLHSGSTKPDYEGYEGNLFLTASNKVKPTIRDVDGRTELVESSGRPYGGCYVNAHIEIYAQDNKYGKRINATLRGIQFVADGDAFSASPPSSDDEFDDLAGGEGVDNAAVSKSALDDDLI